MQTVTIYAYMHTKHTHMPVTEDIDLWPCQECMAAKDRGHKEHKQISKEAEQGIVS